MRMNLAFDLSTQDLVASRSQLPVMHVSDDPSIFQFFIFRVLQSVIIVSAVNDRADVHSGSQQIKIKSKSYFAETAYLLFETFLQNISVCADVAAVLFLKNAFRFSSVFTRLQLPRPHPGRHRV